MKIFLCLLAVTATHAQIGGVQFGGESKTEKVNPRLGLLAGELNVDPLGRQREEQASAPFTQQESSRIPQSGGGEFGGVYSNNGQQCCCVNEFQSCGDSLGREDLVGSGLINPRLKSTTKKPKFEINTRIVNRPGAGVNTNSQQVACPAGQKTCCYDQGVDLSILGRTCINPQTVSERWVQGCNENFIPQNSKTCGTRTYNRPASGLAHGTASPGEFPWTCLILNTNNDFVGSCAIIPNDSGNDNGRGTRKIITAAHKLKDYVNTPTGFQNLKVRIGEWDASGFNQPETREHVEYSVDRIVVHPQYSSRRLSNDIALIHLTRNIDLNHPYINTACLPSCGDQFDFTFRNQTGVRCWVAGWGKDEVDGNFQFLQRKVDLPLVPNGECERGLKVALNNQRRGSGDRFRLDRSEICAGGEIGKDACTGDGGSPLVCQANSGRWTVVGLVTWGVGCASDVPGVYARVSEFNSWISRN